jgi:hypothetical protein
VPTATAPPTIRLSRRVVVGVAAVLVIALVTAATWWFKHADERRVNAACETYLQQRELLRSALSETDEANERAVAAKAGRPEDQYFNDADKVRSWIDQWLSESPGVIDSLDHDKDASSLDRDAVRSLTFVEEGFAELESLIEKSKPSEVADWLPEVGARMQIFDDTCLYAARSTWT